MSRGDLSRPRFALKGGVVASIWSLVLAEAPSGRAHFRGSLGNSSSRIQEPAAHATERE
jgi:hypothetical protein